MERAMVGRRGRRAARVRCIECRASLPLPPQPSGASGVGLSVSCPECGTALEVGGLHVERRPTTVRRSSSLSLAGGARCNAGSDARRSSRLRALRWCIAAALAAFGGFVVLRDPSGTLAALEWVTHTVTQQLFEQW